MSSKPYVWEHQRDDDARDEVGVIIDALLRNYYQTDPAKGPESEGRKFEIAHQTIDLWWLMYDKLVFWAQSHIAGKAWVFDNQDLAKRLAKLWGLDEITENSH